MQTFLIYLENKKITKCLNMLSTDTSLIIMQVRSQTSRLTLNAHNFHLFSILRFCPVKEYLSREEHCKNLKKILKFPFNLLFPLLSIIPSVPNFCGVARHALQNYTERPWEWNNLLFHSQQPFIFVSDTGCLSNITCRHFKSILI